MPELNQTLIFIDKAAAYRGWVVNADKNLTEKIAGGLAKNRGRFGYYACPCRDADGDHAADKDIVCPCAYSQPDIDEHGHCFCGLFLSPEFAATGKKAEAIPERRPET